MKYSACVISQHPDDEQVTDLWQELNSSSLSEAFAAAKEVMKMARAEIGDSDIAISAFIDDPAGSEGWRIDEMADGSYKLCEFGSFVEVLA